MHNQRSFFLFPLLLAALLTLPGCKLEIRVPQGGKVVSTDGAYICEAGQTCLVDVVDLFFDQTFVAEADEGYYFSKWKDKDSNLCGGQTGACRLATADFDNHPELQAFLESEEIFVLEPKFVWTPYCPEPKLVVSPGP